MFIGKKRRLAVVFARALFFCVGWFDYWLKLDRADGPNAGLLQRCDRSECITRVLETEFVYSF